MIDIYSIIEETVKRTGQPEALVEKVVRSMFHDVQDFTSKKRGVNIQIPQVGTFVFRAGAIPNYTNKTKSTLAYWVNRLMVGDVKSLEKTVSAAKNNIVKCFHSLERVADIKQQYINEHSKYKPRTKTYLEEDTHSDPESIRDFIETVKSQLFYEESDYPSAEDLP
jgi:hypothetical protein